MRGLPDALPSTFTTRAAFDLGIQPRELYAWRDQSGVVELSRGVFRRTDVPLASHPDALAIAQRVPGAVVCCLSAAVIHELTDELEQSVQFAVPKGAHVPTIDYPPTTVFQFRVDTFELGLSSFEAAPAESVRVYDPARTVVDLMRLRHRFGEPLAYGALHRFLSRPDSRPGLLLDYAKPLRIFKAMRVALDIASAR